ncbi:MAG: TIGR02647 family protein [Pseudomonadales bacterium]|nr:TIGR02647 family protein [Pseudomonadales bacterium]
MDNNLFEEIKLLTLFNPDNLQEGIKVHHEADPARIAAAQRLFDKQLTTLVDGGYLTPLGVSAAEHVHSLMTILTTEPGLS